LNILRKNDAQQSSSDSPFLTELRYWTPVAGWGLAIWVFSTSHFAENYTSQWIVPVLHWLLPHAQPRTLFRLHHYIRKGAHVFEYFLFSMLLLHAIRRGRPGWRLSWSLAVMGLTVLWAGSDEIHQIFVHGRGPSLRDVLIDGVGAALAQLLAFWWLVKRPRPAPSAPAS
jgi:VanZ family protein